MEFIAFDVCEQYWITAVSLRFRRVCTYVCMYLWFEFSNEVYCICSFQFYFYSLLFVCWTCRLLRWRVFVNLTSTLYIHSIEGNIIKSRPQSIVKLVCFLQLHIFIVVIGQTQLVRIRLGYTLYASCFCSIKLHTFWTLRVSIYCIFD